MSSPNPALGAAPRPRMTAEQYEAAKKKNTQEEMRKLPAELKARGPLPPTGGPPDSEEADDFSSSSSASSGGGRQRRRRSGRFSGSRGNSHGGSTNWEARASLLQVELASAQAERDEAQERVAVVTGLQAALADVAKLALNVSRIARETGVRVELPDALSEGAPGGGPNPCVSPAGAAAGAPLEGAALLRKAEQIDGVLAKRADAVRAALQQLAEPALRAALARSLTADHAAIAKASAALRSHAEEQAWKERAFKWSWLVMAGILALLAVVWALRRR